MATCLAEDESLESWLDKATKDEDWKAIVAFCDRVNKDLTGPQTAIRLLVHKMHSLQEKESLLALTTLEACVKSCGRKFQQEIGKYRFINEIIRVISPKYLGNHTSERVKKRCIDLLCSWSEDLTHEPKIKEAYQMLKRQGIVKQDPFEPNRTSDAEPQLSPKSSIFDNEEKSKLLSNLLKSKNPSDLQAANRLIKNLVKQEAEKTEKVSRQRRQLEAVSNNVKLLSEMINNYSPESSTESDKETMKGLYGSLEKQRPNLFRLASDIDEDKSDAIGDILKANDEVVRVMDSYDQVVASNTVSSPVEPGQKKEEKQSFLKDLEFLSDSVTSSSSQSRLESCGSSLLDEQLLSLGLEVTSTQADWLSKLGASQTDQFDDVFGPVKPTETASNSAASDVFGLHHTSGSSGFGISSALPFNTPLSLSSSSTLNGTAMASVPAPSYSLNTSLGSGSGLVMPVFPASSSGAKGDLFANNAGNAHPGTGSSQQLLSFDLSNLNLPNETKITTTTTTATNSTKTKSSGLDSLNELGHSLLERSLLESQRKTTQPAPKVSMMQLAKSGATATSTTPSSPSASSSVSLVPLVDTTPSTTTAFQPPASEVPSQLISLATTAQKESTNELSEGTEDNSLSDIFVPLDTIQPGSQPPIIAYDKNNLKVTFHFGKDRPRPDVQAFAITTMNTSKSAVKTYSFEASVPKVMRIKLQAASGTDLAAYNPILPPSTIAQVMLVSHLPSKKIPLSFKITYSINEAVIMDVGEVDIPVE